MDQKKFYITTPIYYPSDKLHIGHTYCTVATDAIARYKRLKGFDVMFLTGTDEHGQKIEDKAREAGVSPQEFVDHIVEGQRGVKDLWKLMNVSNDRFIRTTDDYHVESIQKIFRKMYDKGDIYKGTYKGKYCKPCESFWTESQLVDGKCPDCGRDVIDAEEEAYFFRLSKYAGRVRDLLVNTDFLEPRSRVNEMVNNFIDPGLEDLCVSRTSFTWGLSLIHICLANAATTYVGQNVGAGRMDRVRQGTRATLAMGVVWCFAIAAVLMPLSRPIMLLFSKTPAVVDAGVLYLWWVLPFYALFAIQFVLNNVMRGAGDAVFPMISSLISVVVVRVVLCYVISDAFGQQYMFACYAGAWLVGVILSGGYFLLGRWKRFGSMAAAENRMREKEP